MIDARLSIDIANNSNSLDIHRPVIYCIFIRGKSRRDEGNQNCHDVREQQLLDRPSFSIGGGVGIHYHYALLPKIVNDDGIRHQSFEFTSYRQHSTTAATTSTPTSSFLPPAIINARQTKKTFASICHSNSNSKPH